MERCLRPANRRPTDGRYTRNPMRNQRFYQYQVILKPSPDNIVDIYLDSLRAIGFDPNPKRHPVCRRRLGESGCWCGWSGLGSMGHGTEVTQFTFFQQMGGIECNPVSPRLPTVPSAYA